MTLIWTASALIGLHIGGIAPASLPILSDLPAVAQAPTTLSKPLPPSDRQAIQRCFVAYKQALLDKDGDLAVAQVSTTTLTYYGKMRDLALRGDGTTVRSRSLIDQYLVLVLRHRVGLEALLPMSDQEVISLAIREGWIGESGLRETNIGAVTIKGDRADAVLVVRGKAYATPDVPRFVFLKEQKSWKIDITALFPVAEKFFQDWYAGDKASKNISTDTFLINVLSLTSGKPVSPDIWKPLVRS
jgi:hypothetical protein